MSYRLRKRKRFSVSKRGPDKSKYEIPFDEELRNFQENEQHVSAELWLSHRLLQTENDSIRIKVAKTLYNKDVKIFKIRMKPL